MARATVTFDGDKLDHLRKMRPEISHIGYGDAFTLLICESIGLQGQLAELAEGVNLLKLETPSLSHLSLIDYLRWLVGSEIERRGCQEVNCDPKPEPRIQPKPQPQEYCNDEPSPRQPVHVATGASSPPEGASGPSEEFDLADLAG